MFISSSGICVQQRVHVALVRDRDADLADLAAGELVIGVVAGLRRQVEGDREAGLALGEVLAVELVRLAGAGVPGVGAHHPRAVAFGKSMIGLRHSGDGYATDGTPVDCVRLAALGLIDDFPPDLVVSGINHGLNLGDDITYSGTVAAAFEALLLGLPAIAVSQQSARREIDFRLGARSTSRRGAAFAARHRRGAGARAAAGRARCSTSTCPAGEPNGVEVTRLGKRIYEDVLELQDEVHPNRRLFRIYGDAGSRRRGRARTSPPSPPGASPSRRSTST